jgi:hypothetical protein
MIQQAALERLENRRMESGSAVGAPLSPLNGPQTHKLSTRWVLWFDYPSKGGLTFR